MAVTERGTAHRAVALALSGLLAACGALTPGSGYDANAGRPRSVPSATAVPTRTSRCGSPSRTRFQRGFMTGLLQGAMKG